MSWVDALGYADLYDFLYLPIDFNTRANKGFAFVNFPRGSDAARFIAETNQMRVGARQTVLKVIRSRSQGLEDNLAFWSAARCRRVRDSKVLPFIRPHVAIGVLHPAELAGAAFGGHELELNPELETLPSGPPDPDQIPWTWLSASTTSCTIGGASSRHSAWHSEVGGGASSDHRAWHSEAHAAAAHQRSEPLPASCVSSSHGAWHSEQQLAPGASGRLWAASALHGD